MRVAAILTVYFLVGAIATAVAAARVPAPLRRPYWVKYGVYLALTALLVWLIGAAPEALPYVAALLGLGGYAELVQAERMSPVAGRRLLAQIVYGCCALLLFLFSTHAADTSQFLHVYVLVVAFDGFSQISGQLFRSPKLMPRISPGKTVAGLAGGLAAVALTGLLLEAPRYGSGAALGLGTGVAAFTGDALASLYKRRLHIKDYSSLIPGHGGLLDRFDSLLVAGAVAEIIFYLLPALR